jgi:NAD-specific glutamate dehydrogenase
VARGTLRDNLYSLQRTLASRVLSRGNSKDPAHAIDGWLAKRKGQFEYIQRTVNDMRSGVTADFPTLSVALQAVRRMAEQ